ncbi:Fc.00g071380.m01.CDS01 [Cosmosporella sp. VM-42]
MPKLEALRTLEALRNATDATAILATLRGGMEGKQRPSDITLASSVSNTSTFSLELLAHHPFAYPNLMPMEITDADGSKNLVLKGLAESRGGRSGAPSQYSRGGLSGTIPHVPSSLKESRSSNSESSDSSCSSIPDSPFIHQPRQAGTPKYATLCDDRLGELQIQYWTSVKLSNDLAARIISLYLRTDHPLLGLFSPNLFVADLVSRRTQHCSPLLVSALMYWACQMYSTIDHEANNLINEFRHEAVLRWRVESKSDFMPNMAAAIYLSLGSLGRGKDHIVSEYLSVAASMGSRMGLFGVELDVAHAKLGKLAPDETEQACFTAWGVFNSMTILSVFYRQPGVKIPRLSPALPIPGSQDTGLKDPRSERLATTAGNSHHGSFATSTLPKYMGDTFPFLCKFWLILNEVDAVYYSGKTPQLRERVLLQFAEFKFRELLALGDSLPTSFSRGHHNPHHVIIFHLWFHSAILDIFRPCLARPSSRNAHLRTFASPEGTPGILYAASVEQLKRLIVIYRVNYRSSAYTMLWQTGLLYVANAVLQDTESDDWLFYFLVCLYGYERLRPSFPVTEAITEGLLTMSLRDNKITTAMARRIRSEVCSKDLGHSSEEMTSTFAVDLLLSVSDPTSASVDNLAGGLEDHLLMKDLTNVFDV